MDVNCLIERGALFGMYLGGSDCTVEKLYRGIVQKARKTIENFVFGADRSHDPAFWLSFKLTKTDDSYLAYHSKHLFPTQ